MNLDLFPSNKMPRQYAAEISALATRAERVAALEEVPTPIRELVKKHVEIYFLSRKHEKEQGQTLAQSGAKQAADHADAVHGDWSERAYQLLKRYPGRKFMAEEVAKWAYGQGLPKPPTGRAWGAVINRAKKEKIIRHIGYDRVSNEKAHSTPASVWEKVA